MSHSLRIAAFLMCWGVSAAAMAGVRCDQIFREGNSFDRLFEGLHESVEKQPDFPVLATTEFLMQHYRSINLQIGDYLVKSRSQMTPDHQARLSRLSRVNKELHSLSIKIQKTVASSGTFLMSKERAAAKADRLMDEANRCRSGGEACAIELRAEFDTMAKYHEGLKNIDQTLAEEIQALDALMAFSAIQESGDILNPLIQQSQALKVSQMTLRAQLQSHRAMVTEAEQQLAKFDAFRKTAARTLPPAPVQGRRSFDPGVEKFEAGAQVLAAWFDKHGNFRLGQGTVKQSAAGDRMDIVLDKISLTGKKTVSVETGMSVLTGCIGGVCFGRAIRLRHGLPTRDLKPPEKSVGYVTRSFNGDFKVMGFNPLTKEFLLRDGFGKESGFDYGPTSSEFFWVRAEDLIAVAHGKPAPSLACHGGLCVGDLVRFHQTDKATDDVFAVAGFKEGKIVVQRLWDLTKRKSIVEALRGNDGGHPVSETEIFKIESPRP